MVAVISSGHSISRILRYNEDKVSHGQAKILGEGNCPFTADSVGLMPKLNYMVRIAALNTKVTRNSVHISLNFSTNELNLGDNVMLDIAHDYMQQIGFGSQPWIAYRHFDAGHPHLHLVSLKIRPDGTRIDMQNIGRNQSEMARKDIEQKYGLVPAQNQGNLIQYRPEPIAVSRLHYGKAATKKAIGTVVQFVLQKYRFTSIAELNAVLGLYNVRADQGKVTSRTFVSGGLRYHALNAESNPVGVPIKASAFHFLPTVKRLETLFSRNTGLQSKSKLYIKNTVDICLLKNPLANLAALQQILKYSAIDMVLRSATNGQVYGVTFVDHKNYCVVNGSALGKDYSAKGLQQRLQNGLRDTGLGRKPSATIDPAHHAPVQDTTGATRENSIMETLLNPETAPEYTAQGFSGRRKPKKRKGRH